MLSRLAMGRFIREAVENLDSALNISHRTFKDDQKSSIYTSPTKNELPLNPERAAVKSSPEVVNSDTWIDSGEGSNKYAAPQSGTPMDATTRIVGENGKRNKRDRSKKRMLSNSSDAQRGSDGHSGKMHCHAGTKMLIFSGHDSTMVPLLKAIGLYHGAYDKNILL